MEIYDLNLKEVYPDDPKSIPKFIDPLPIPAVAIPNMVTKEADYYEIVMKESKHRFHSCFPLTKFWGYNGCYPGPTIKALKDRNVLVKWINNLPQKHFLPIDHTIHGAIGTPDVRTVVHLHGANVAPDSDGHPEAWFTKDYFCTGRTFSRKVYKYTNHQQGTTLWYHDHSMGITRLNVYAGLAGFYLLKDSMEKRLNLPSGDYDIPMMIQDKSFDREGRLFYPDAPPFPVDVKPSITPGFFGNTMVVNGKVWPYLDVEPRKYRFRILNACNRRELNLSLSNGSEFYQIGTDGGLLHHSIQISSFILDPAERIEIVIDFSKFKGKKLLLQNIDNDPNMQVVMRFNVGKCVKCEDTSEVPKELYPFDHVLEEDMAQKVRNLTLSASRDHYGRPMLLLNNKMWTDPATEKPELDSIELWNLVNPIQGLAHPIHVHLVQFKILGRRPFNVNKFLADGTIEFTTDEIEPPRPYETGWKDVVRADGGKITMIIMHFKDHPGDYVWHCHFLEHEDHDMMRPLRVTKDCLPID